MMISGDTVISGKESFGKDDLTSDRNVVRDDSILWP